MILTRIWPRFGLIVAVALFSVTLSQIGANGQVESFIKHEIVPDILNRPPRSLLGVRYPPFHVVAEGDELTPTQAKTEPDVLWEANPDKFYSLIFLGPDLPSRTLPRFREVRQWLAVNIPGRNVSAGEIIVSYDPPIPPEGTGLHRYIFLVYEQPTSTKTVFNETVELTGHIPHGRLRTSTRDFAAKYGLGDPIAGNFFQAEWDESVPRIYEQLAQLKGFGLDLSTFTKVESQKGQEQQLKLKVTTSAPVAVAVQTEEVEVTKPTTTTTTIVTSTTPTTTTEEPEPVSAAGPELESFRQHQIVPDILDRPPRSLLAVQYSQALVVQEGNELTPTQIQSQPEVSWDAEPDRFYTLITLDPDSPSRKQPTFREGRLWLVGNIPGNNVSAGDVICAYLSPHPTEGSGLHRYVFLLYKQPSKSKLVFNETVELTGHKPTGRVQTSTRAFAATYELGDPLAGNFFQAEWDESVPRLYEQLASLRASGLDLSKFGNQQRAKSPKG